MNIHEVMNIHGFCLTVDAAHFSVSVQTDGRAEEESKELMEGYKAEVAKLEAELRKQVRKVQVNLGCYKFLSTNTAIIKVHTSW